MKHKIYLILSIVLACWLAAGHAWAGTRPHGPPPWVEDPKPDTDIVLRIEALEEMSAYLQLDLDTVLVSTLPEGTIMAFAGTEDTIPEGWALCNGENGTPDLLDRFVVGASSDLDLGEKAGTTEHSHGSLDHFHQLRIPEHDHEIPEFEEETNSAGDHKHTVGAAEGNSLKIDIDLNGNADWSPAGHSHGMATIDGDHEHQLQVSAMTTGPAEGVSPTTSVALTTELAEHIPPYYKLAFIVKLGAEDGSIDVAPSSSLTVRLSTLEEDFSFLDSSLDAIASDLIPLGLIVAWTGSLEDLPEGWLLCNGDNGTLNLVDRFILGASIDEEIGTMSDDGAHSHTPGNHVHEVTLPVHLHERPNWNGTTMSVPDHVHNWVSAEESSVTVRKDDDSDYTAQGAHSHTFSPAGGHAHNLFIPEALTSIEGGWGLTEISTSRSNQANVLPPYYKLAFIQKVETTESVDATESGGITEEVASSDSLERIENLEYLVATMLSTLDVIVAFLAPEEGIGLWSGSLAAVPEGWAFCDGIGVTPDLRESFVMGTEDSIGVTGGRTDHLHWMDPDPHSHKAILPHSHPVNATMVYDTGTGGSEHLHREWTSYMWGGDYTGIPEGNICSALHQHGYWGMTYVERHGHQVELNNYVDPQNDSLWSATGESVSATSRASHLPPFIRLAYIMKLPEFNE